MANEVVSLFCGGGIKTLGAMAAGYSPVLGVEYDESIAASYAENVGAVKVAKVEETDPRPYAGIGLLLASPVCTRASVANAGRGETEVDRAAAEGVCRWLREARPERFVMENVTQYREFDSCQAILRTLTELGYWWSADNVNFADLGVPQTRRRLIVRAVRDAMLPSLPAPTPWIGWYAAIEDLIPTLPESRFADWQLKRLPAEFGSFLHPHTTADGSTPPRGVLDPAFSIQATIDKAIPKALLVGGANTSDVQAAPGVGVSAMAPPSRCVATNSIHWRARLVSNGGAHGDLFRLPGQDAPAVTGQSEGRVRGFLVSDFTEAGGERVGVPHSDAPAATVRTNATGGAAAKAFLVHGTSTMEVKQAEEPSACVVATIHAKAAVPRAWLERGRVVALTPRALGRLQTLPDSYRLPESRRLACTIIGNAAPAEGMRRIIEGLS